MCLHYVKKCSKSDPTDRLEPGATVAKRANYVYRNNWLLLLTNGNQQLQKTRTSGLADVD